MRTLILALCAAALGACSSTIDEPALGTDAAVVTVVFTARPADTLQVLITDPATIAAAEAYVRTGSGPRLVSGTIVRGAGWDTRYPFHFVAESVRLVDVGMEICDGAPMKTSKDIDDFFGWATGSPNSNSAQWCPWGSSPVAVQRLGHGS